MCVHRSIEMLTPRVASIKRRNETKGWGQVIGSCGTSTRAWNPGSGFAPSPTTTSRYCNPDGVVTSSAVFNVSSHAASHRSLTSCSSGSESARAGRGPARDPAPIAATNAPASAGVRSAKRRVDNDDDGAEADALTIVAVRGRDARRVTTRGRTAGDATTTTEAIERYDRSTRRTRRGGTREARGAAATERPDLRGGGGRAVGVRRRGSEWRGGRAASGRGRRRVSDRADYLVRPVALSHQIILPNYRIICDFFIPNSYERQSDAPPHVRASPCAAAAWIDLKFCRAAICEFRHQIYAYTPREKDGNTVFGPYLQAR